jgi:hypothetical protein
MTQASEILTYLRDKLSAAEKDHAKAKEALSLAANKESSAAMAVSTYKATLELEQGTPQSSNGSGAKPATRVATDDIGPSSKKTNVARQFAIEATQGFVASALRDYLFKQGMNDNPTFAFNFVFRMAQRGELEKRGKRYFATDKMKKFIA